MRVISQNGRLSVDFDTSVFEIGENHIYAEPLGINRVLIGSFKNPERVKEIFSEMHENYSDEFKTIDSARLVYKIPKE